MTDKEALEEIEYNQERLYAFPLFTEKTPRSRVIKQIGDNIKANLQFWPRDSQNNLVEFKALQHKDKGYYLLATDGDWVEPLRPEAGGGRISKVLNWWEQILQTFSELTPWENDWNIVTFENIRLTKSQDIRIIPPPFAEIITRYNYSDQVLDPNHYRPPEDIKTGEQKKGEKSLVFSLGVIIYTLLTGEPPYQGRDQTELLDRILNGRRLAAEKIRPELPPQFSQLIDECLQVDPDDRPEIKRLLAEVKKLKSSNEQISVSVTSEQKKKLKQQRKKFKWKQSFVYNLKQRWHVFLTIFVIVVGAFLFIYTAGHDEYVNPEHSPAEVTEIFYDSLDQKNVVRLEDTAVIDLGQLRRMVSETHVIESVRRLYDLEDTDEDELVPEVDLEVEEESSFGQDSLFGIRQLDIRTLQDGPEALVEASYIFYLNTDDNKIDWQARDYVSLERRDGRWQIVGFDGFIEGLIRGEFLGL
ncbi:MAG: protein kinase domain-containing protein [Bacillota bacterium]